MDTTASTRGQSEHRILIVAPAWVGDVVMSQSLYMILRRRYADALIDVMAPSTSIALVQRMAEVNRGIRFDMPHGEIGLARRKAFGQGLKQNLYTQAIILPNSLKSALVPFHAGIPLRTAFRGEYRYFLINDMRLLHKPSMPRMIDRFAALGLRQGKVPDEVPWPALMIDTNNQGALLQALGLNRHRPIVGICPGAEFGDAKKWPEEHYGRIAQEMIRCGKQVWIFGGPADQMPGENILHKVKAADQQYCINLAGKTSIVDVIDLLHLCQQVICNDSGLMHIAAAVGCPVTVVYGSTSPEFTPPLTSKQALVSLGLPCAPCFKRTCPLGHKDCLNKLTPQRILSVIKRQAAV